MFYIFLSGYNSRTIQDIKFKFSVVLSFVEPTTCEKFQSAIGAQVLKLTFFRINPIAFQYNIVKLLYMSKYNALCSCECLKTEVSR